MILLVKQLTWQSCVTAGERFGEYNIKKVVNAENVEIDEVDVIRDGDHLYLLSTNVT